MKKHNLKLHPNAQEQNFRRIYVHGNHGKFTFVFYLFNEIFRCEGTLSMTAFINPPFRQSLMPLRWLVHFDLIHRFT